MDIFWHYTPMPTQFLFKLCIFVGTACSLEPQKEGSELCQLLVTICTLPEEKLMMMIHGDDNDHDDSAYKDIKEDTTSFHQSQHIMSFASRLQTFPILRYIILKLPFSFQCSFWCFLAPFSCPGFESPETLGATELKASFSFTRTSQTNVCHVINLVVSLLLVWEKFSSFLPSSLQNLPARRCSQSRQVTMLSFPF